MEEIDNIIIETLKHLKCDLDEEIKSVRDFDPDMIVDAIVRCLEVITPDINLPHKLSPSMSLRLKLATNLSEYIRGLGFRGDIGYQTILYCNDVEVRRVLMFLIERLPRDIDEDIPIQQTGYAYNLTKRIEEKLKLSLEKAWIPAHIVHGGVREYENDFIKTSYRYTCPMRTEYVQIPTSEFTSEDQKEYWIYHVNDVTRQCSDGNLITSILFTDANFADVNLIQEHSLRNKEFSYAVKDENISATSAVSLVKSDEENKWTEGDADSAQEDEKEMLIKSIKVQNRSMQQLKQEVNLEKARLAKITGEKEAEENSLKDLLSRHKIKSRTVAVLSKEENLEKLKGLIKNGHERLIELENQWNEVEKPLIAEYEVLSNDVTAVGLKQQKELEHSKDLKEKRKRLMEELNDKDKLEKTLKEERDRLNKNIRRSAYTRRILEIIGNIKKQNEEIQKILNDTRVVQKDINTLNGQLDRSFTLSDELIFRNAKQDEMSRKAYKLLAALHNDCGAIIEAITEIGSVERESRNLQEQIDNEVNKATGISLDRVNADIQNIKKEIALLMEQSKMEK